MKIKIIAILLSATLSSAFSQGLVYFNSGASSATHISTNNFFGNPDTGPILGTNQYYFALFVSTSQTTVGGVSTAQGGWNVNLFQNLGGGTPSTGWELVGIGANGAPRTGAFSCHQSRHHFSQSISAQC